MIETLTEPVLMCAFVQGFPGLMGERGDRGEKGDKVCKPKLKEMLQKSFRKIKCLCMWMGCAQGDRGAVGKRGLKGQKGEQGPPGLDQPCPVV